MSQSSGALLGRLRGALAPPSSSSQEAGAAVLLLIDPEREGLPVLFIRRSEAVSTHQGQLALPGGKADPKDTDIVATALREANEEVGVPADAVEVLGLLPTVVTGGTGWRLATVVGVVRRAFPVVPDNYEVGEWFWLPLESLARAAWWTRPVPSAPERPVYFCQVGDRIVWGATARIVRNLLDRMDWLTDNR